MRSSDVLIAVPTRGSIRNELVSRLQAIRDHDANLSPFLYSAGHLSSHETREAIVTYFMSTEKKALIMIDDDTVPPMHIMRLTQWFLDYDIVGAAVPTFQPKVAPIPMLAAYNYVADQGWVNLDDVWGQQSVVTCDAVGFGCVAIHRRVFEMMLPPYFPLMHNEQGFVTDDLSFCFRAKGNGFSVACDFEVKCEHYSTVPLMKLSEGVSGLIDATLEAHGVVMREEPAPVA